MYWFVQLPEMKALHIIITLPLTPMPHFQIAVCQELLLNVAEFWHLVGVVAGSL